MTPNLVLKITRAAAETRSFERATTVMKDVAGMPVSAKTIERVVHDDGGELAERRDADPRSDRALALTSEGSPQLAVVECDGGVLPAGVQIPFARRTSAGGLLVDGEGWPVGGECRLMAG